MSATTVKKFDEALERGVTAADGTTKAKIERAALFLFQQGEMDKATTRAIAARAGISEGALYRHYKSKEEIWEGLFYTIHARLGDLAMAAHLSSDHVREQAAALVRAYCQTADDDWQLFCFHLLSLHRFLPLKNPVENDPVGACEIMAMKAMENGQVKKADPILTAGMALGVVLQPALHKAYGRLAIKRLPRRTDTRCHQCPEPNQIVIRLEKNDASYSVSNSLLADIHIFYAVCRTAFTDPQQEACHDVDVALFSHHVFLDGACSGHHAGGPRS